MRTVVIPPPGVFGFGRSRTYQVAAHPLTPAEAELVCDQLARRATPIPVNAGVQHGVVHLVPGRALSTAEEVVALRAFALVTDSRLLWHGTLKTQGVPA